MPNITIVITEFLRITCLDQTGYSIKARYEINEYIYIFFFLDANYISNPLQLRSEKDLAYN